MDIGATIKKLRIQNGLTQYQLAEYLNVSMQTVSRWETSSTYPDIVMLPILSKRFNVTIDYLLKGGNLMKTIESSRMRIREWDESDASALHEIELKACYLKFNTVNDSLEAIRIWKEYQEMYPVILKETGKLIGIAGLVDVNRYKGYRELEIHICDKYCDASYVTELHKLILDYGFNDMGILVAFALCNSNDEILLQAMKNIGFVYEGTLRKFGRDMSDRMRYSITREEYLAV
jgi:RimJ/RimL family protein N-acetyltransferase